MAHVSLQQTPWPLETSPIEFECPYCHAVGPARSAWDQLDRLNFMFTHRTAWLVCASCGKQSLSTVPLAELASLPLKRRDVFVVRYQSLVARVTTWAGILLCWAPIIGMVMSSCALAITWRRPGWTRRLARVAFVIALGMSVLFVIATMSDSHAAGR